MSPVLELEREAVNIIEGDVVQVVLECLKLKCIRLRSMADG